MSHTQPDSPVVQYWHFMEQLKAGSIYARLYRNQTYQWVRALEIVKAIAGNGAIAAWVIFQKLPLLWSAIIAASQFLDAIKGVFPFAAQHKQAASLTAALDLMMLDAEDQWQNAATGPTQGEKLMAALQRLRRLKLETEQKFFPDGIADSKRLRSLAETEAKAYLKAVYETP